MACVLTMSCRATAAQRQCDNARDQEFDFILHTVCFHPDFSLRGWDCRALTEAGWLRFYYSSNDSQVFSGKPVGEPERRQKGVNGNGMSVLLPTSVSPRLHQCTAYLPRFWDSG